MILAIDQGTTGTTCLVFDGEGRLAGRRLLGVRAALPAAGLGRARRGRDLGGDAAGRRRGDRRRRDRGRRAGRDRDHQPARDRGRLGPGDRRADPPGAGLAGPAHRRALRRAARGRARGAGARADRADDRPLLLGDQDRVAAAKRRGGGAGGLRHDRLLAPLQADRPPRHRLLQRLADDAVRHPPPRLGPASCCELLGIDPARLPEPLPSAHVFGTTTEFGGEVPVAGIAGDQQAALFGQACHSPGMAKNTYGTGSFVLLNTGPEAPQPPEGLLTTIAWGLERGGHLRARGLDLRHRGRGAVAAGRARDHRRGGGDRGAGGLARLQRRRLLRPRADRARLAALGPLRARHDRRPHPRQRPRAPGAGGAGGDRLPDRRRGPRPGGGRRRSGSRC